MNREHRRSISPSNADEHSRQRNWLNSRRLVMLCAAVAIVGGVLLTGHSNHLIEFLPYLLLLACPFMHFFMHRRHGSDDQDAHDGRGCH